MVESTRLESERAGNRTVGSNPTLSAISNLYGIAFFVYLWRTLRFEECDGILCPGLPNICLRLFLPLAHPWSIVLLRDLHAGMPE